MPQPKKIVITGPESTGKSTLCEQLATNFNTNWVPEYAREYLMKLARPYTYDDLLIIAKGQLDQEDRITASLKSTLVFIDTDMYVMKVWCEFVFGKCHSFILDEIVKRKYDVYLLCNTDLPWVADELREYPDLESRERLYYMYKDHMINQTTPWIDIKGDYEQRLSNAISFINVANMEM
ncbi:MAG TPA: ATP-binding protein [Puia sp.]|jgi:NadR type nicotinamide-nucleotide adenylyltransferase|nr:ATP-binding protein [Puia sp.]